MERSILLRDFTLSPGPRFIHEGDYSGEEWRDKYLLPAFKDAQALGDRLLVDLDGVDGFASSFLEEAFGGLIRATGQTATQVNAVLSVVCTDEPAIVDEILNTYLPRASGKKR